MSSVKDFLFNNGDVQIKKEIGGGSSSKVKNEKPFFNDDNMSCVYNSQSPSAKTILINNYAPTNSTKNSSINGNKSSITIFTHNSDPKEGSSNIAPKSPTSSGGGTVVLDRINILINNHFNEPPKISPEKTVTPTNIPTTAKVNTTKMYEMPETKPNTSSIDDDCTIIEDTVDDEVKCEKSKTDQMPEGQFKYGEDVLALQEDERHHLGVILATSPQQCLVQFGGSGGRQMWTDIDKLSTFDKQDLKSFCVVCKEGHDNTFVDKCKICNRGYHYKCTDVRNNLWFCKRKHINFVKNIKEIDLDRIIDETNNKTNNLQKLPYDLNSLNWDERHRSNKEHHYCYCGQNGNWYLQMIQCSQCLQWFHEHCIQTVQCPVYCGDRFYLFSCSLCNKGSEFLCRLKMKMEDLVHLILFNLTIHHTYSSYYDAVNIIVPYALDNWNTLQLSPMLKNMDKSDIKEQILNILKENTKLYKTKGNKFCLIKSMKTPSPPKLNLPANVVVTEQNFKEILRDKLEFILPEDCFTSSLQSVNVDEVRHAMAGISYLSYLVNDNSFKSIEYEDSKHDSEDEVLANLVNNPKIKRNSKPATSPPTTITNGYDDVSRDSFGSKSNNEKRKRGRPRLFELAKKTKRSDVIDLCDSSDDTTSSRGTLDLIIPPPKDFQGFNNPFLSQSTKLLSEQQKQQTPTTSTTAAPTNSAASVSLVPTSSVYRPPQSIFSNPNFCPTSNQMRIVRTIKRRLSAKDLIIGPNQEVKKRKLRQRSDTIEVISTSAVHESSLRNIYLPIRTDSRDFSSNVPSNKSNVSHNNFSNLATSSADTNSKNKVSNNRLRKRGNKNYSENHLQLRRNSTSNLPSSSSSTSSISSAGNLQILSNSPVKNGANGSDGKDDTLIKLTTYFGCENRIENGERFEIIGKRVNLDGRVQYLVEWEGIS